MFCGLNTHNDHTEATIGGQWYDPSCPLATPDPVTLEIHIYVAPTAKARVFMHTCHMCVCACVCAYVCVHMYVCVHDYVCACACVCVCMCTCMCVYVCMCMYGGGVRTISPNKISCIPPPPTPTAACLGSCCGLVVVSMLAVMCCSVCTCVCMCVCVCV